MTTTKTPTSAVPGQRWISNTEPELGLGILLKSNGRQVTVGFPAANQQRIYALDNAPITRVEYRAGDTIRDNNDNVITVAVVDNEDGYITYRGNNIEGESCNIPEIKLDSFVQFSKPKERLFAGQIDKLRAFILRKQTSDYWYALNAQATRGLLGPRVQLLPHQFYVANEVANRYAPRVLLADEVGLGKTIEAGLILHQQIISGRAQRILIVVPESLVHQWLVEFLRRFNMQFTILDHERCHELMASDEGNPFESSQLVLCSLSLFTEQQEMLQQAATCDWDMLVVDEAHHLSWSPEQPSVAYQCIETLAQKALGLLLLTATPEQLGVESHFARLRLLDPDRYHDFETFCAEHNNYQPISELLKTLNAAEGVDHLLRSQRLQQTLDNYIGEQRRSELLKQLEATEDTQHQQQLLDHLVREILDCHGTGRILFRNTRATVSGFPKRVLNTHPLEAPEAFIARVSGDLEAVSDDHLAATLINQLQPDTLLGEDWPEIDSRAEWLVNWLKQHRDEKTLIICARASTALDLELFLRLRNGIRCSIFHEGMSLIERDRAAAYFAEDDGGAQILICSEIGSEGRNFQFSRHLILFDLPFNPDLLEQRIGRLDRIGQQHTIQIHVPHYAGTTQADLLRWYHEGLNAFEQSNPAAQAIFTRFEKELVNTLQQHSLHDSINDRQHAGFEQLLNETRQFAEATLAELRKGRDPLLELNSCHLPTATNLINAVTEDAQAEQLSCYMENVFDHFGVEHEHHSEQAIVVRPSDHMHYHHFPALPEDGLTATYDRDTALSRDDIHFLTWEHPMVSGAMDMVLHSETGNTAICTVKLPPVKPGTLLVEVFFKLHCPAPPILQLQRYLSQPITRVLIDSSNANLGNVITTEHLDKRGKKIDKNTARQLIAHAKTQIDSMISQAEQQVSVERDKLVTEAIDKMTALQQAELHRLEQLAKVNPNIRQQEIEYIKVSTQTLQGYLENAQFQLDALRVAIVT